jgi:hypothetical protein
MTMKLTAYTTSGRDIYAVLLTSSGQAWNGSAFEAISAPSWASYDIAMPAVAAGVYSYVVYEQPGRPSDNHAGADVRCDGQRAEHPSALAQTPDEATNYAAYQKIENRLDMWAGVGGPVGMAYNRIKDAQARGWGPQMHFVRYEMLTAKPAETMAAIYQFLGEELFQHDFENVAQVTTEDDRVYGFAHLHTIRPQVQAQPPSWPSILGSHADKYKNQEIW